MIVLRRKKIVAAEYCQVIYDLKTECMSALPDTVGLVGICTVTSYSLVLASSRPVTPVSALKVS